jgi:hypothetical protein
VFLVVSVLLMFLVFCVVFLVVSEHIKLKT